MSDLRSRALFVLGDGPETTATGNTPPPPPPYELQPASRLGTLAYPPRSLYGIRDLHAGTGGDS
jgi:hypothetical protein